jgi:hypothetical protein
MYPTNCVKQRKVPGDMKGQATACKHECQLHKHLLSLATSSSSSTGDELQGSPAVYNVAPLEWFSAV